MNIFFEGLLLFLSGSVRTLADFSAQRPDVQCEQLGQSVMRMGGVGEGADFFSLSYR